LNELNQWVQVNRGEEVMMEMSRNVPYTELLKPADLPAFQAICASDTNDSECTNRI
jgi:hypothetical protein